MQSILITTTATPDAADRALLSGGLDDFNRETVGTSDDRPLGVLVTDEQSGKVLGGITGRTSLGLLFIDLFYLPAGLRGSGLGAELLRRAEGEGRARGCRSAVLYTISFQAPGFYQKCGWRVFGEVACDPPGTSRIFLTKDLMMQESSADGLAGAAGNR